MKKYLDLKDCEPVWESSVPRCSGSCPAIISKLLCTLSQDLTYNHLVCIPMVQHMKHTLDLLQKEDLETEDMIEETKKGGGAHG